MHSCTSALYISLMILYRTYTVVRDDDFYGPRLGLAGCSGGDAQMIAGWSNFSTVIPCTTAPKVKFIGLTLHSQVDPAV